MIKLHEIESIELLSETLGVSIDFLREFIQEKTIFKGKKLTEKFDFEVFRNTENLESYFDCSSACHFLEMHIPKRNRLHGYRTVYAPRGGDVEGIYKAFQMLLNGYYAASLHDSAHGFVKKRNIKSNASPHIGKNIILNVDIKDFFGSITKKLIEEHLLKVCSSKEIVDVLAEIATLNGFLFQGVPTSPMLANMIVKGMDIEITELCNKLDCVYTRYSDDITISSNGNIVNVSDLEEIISKYGLILNPLKTKSSKRGQHQYVTGLTVFDSKYPRIPKRIKKKIRQTIYYCNKFGIQSVVLRKLHLAETDLNDPIIRERVDMECAKLNGWLMGWIYFIHSIEPAVATKMSEGFRLMSRLDGEERQTLSI